MLLAHSLDMKMSPLRATAMPQEVSVSALDSRTAIATPSDAAAAGHEGDDAGLCVDAAVDHAVLVVDVEVALVVEAQVVRIAEPGVTG